MLKLEDIKMELGTQLYFQVDPENISRAILIGMKPKQYIATTYPMPDLFKKNTTDVLVYFCNGANVYEFNTKILRLLYDPVELILLKYPEYVSIREQRNYKRIKCLVSAKVYFKDKSRVLEGIIKDISKKGCRIMFPIKTQEKKFYRGEPVVIICKFPGIPGKQEITAIIRNIVESDNDISIGIEFDELAWWAPPY